MEKATRQSQIYFREPNYMSNEDYNYRLDRLHFFYPNIVTSALLLSWQSNAF